VANGPGAAAGGGSPASGGARTGASAGHRAAATRRAAAIRARDRRLRRTVQRLDGCLSALGPRVRRVLVLRAGIGGARPHSRAGVARILRIRVPRVARLERRGVRRLQGLDRVTGCGDGRASHDPTAAAVPAVGTGSALAASPGAPGGGEPSKSGRSRRRGGVLGSSSDRPPATILPGPETRPGGPSQTLLIIIAGIAVMAWLGVKAVRRRFE
jgi:hypothetical protein